MAINFRGYIETLKDNDELTTISRSTDLRDVAALVPQSDKALLFTNLRGYSIPVAYNSGYAVVAVSFLLTAATWGVAYGL